MSGNHFLIDTNIALYLLGGDKDLAEIIQGSKLYVSFITQLELLGYQGISIKEQKHVSAFLEDVIIVDINQEIKKAAIRIRQKHSVKLPDAIIAATSQFLDVPLFTADLGFRKINSLNLVLFTK
jgi:predicted nucleic acid-binding protein